MLCVSNLQILILFSTDLMLIISIHDICDADSNNDCYEDNNADQGCSQDATSILGQLAAHDKGWNRESG